jgi:MFS family permease
MNLKRLYPWILVGLLWFVALLNYMDRQMLSTMKPSMQADITELQSAASFGYLMAIFLWIYGLMSPVAGIIADRINRKWLIICSLFVWSGVTMAMGYATTFNQLYWLRAIMGISEALYIPAGLSLIADYHSSSTRSLAVGILHGSGPGRIRSNKCLRVFVAADISYIRTHWNFLFIDTNSVPERKKGTS